MDLVIAILIFFVVGLIITGKIAFRTIRNDMKSGRIGCAAGSASGKFMSKRCFHESMRWEGRGGLENVGILARICEICGEEIETRVVYCDDKGNILRTRKM